MTMLENRNSFLKDNWPKFLPSPIPAKGGVPLHLYHFTLESTSSRFLSVQIEFYGCEMPAPRSESNHDNAILLDPIVNVLFLDFCPDGFNETTNGECLKIVESNVTLTFEDAKALCKSQSAILYEPISPEANANLKEMSDMLPSGTEQAWIGNCIV